jgi:7-carboxy-7-deazaguanine synthase
VRVSEVYASTQGEGPNVGRTTVFTRFGGCNLRCPGWPCDTQHAIDPAYRHEWDKLTPGQVGERVVTVSKVSGATYVTLTGGEPFLQPTAELETLVQFLTAEGFKVDCFSNGTLIYPWWAIDRIQFIMDWKLPGSGETKFGPLNTNRFKNVKLLGESWQQQAVKYVIKDYTDYLAAKQLWEEWVKPRPNILPYYGRVWDCDVSDAQLVEWVMKDKLPWLLNRQEHNYIWPPNERGR